MARDSVQFDALVKRMERVAAERPRLYRWRVFGLAALGYLYLLLVVLVLLVLLMLAVLSSKFLGFLGANLVLVVGALLWAVVRALWVPTASPPGEPVSRG